jgi:hypothetical protein
VVRQRRELLDCNLVAFYWSPLEKSSEVVAPLRRFREELSMKEDGGKLRGESKVLILQGSGSESEDTGRLSLDSTEYKGDDKRLT